MARVEARAQGSLSIASDPTGVEKLSQQFGGPTFAVGGSATIARTTREAVGHSPALRRRCLPPCSYGEVLPRNVSHSALVWCRHAFNGAQLGRGSWGSRPISHSTPEGHLP